MNIKLKKSLLKDEKEITELNLDLDSITGKEIIAAEKEARLMGDQTSDLGFSKTFQAILAAKAAQEAVIGDDIMGLTAPDFMLITNTVSNFLFGWVLPGKAQENS